MNFSLIGPSGAGKGTHAAVLARTYSMTLVATGELFRANLENRTAVGFLAQRFIDKGALVPDEVAEAMVAERLWQITPEEDVIFDGFPRTVDQARFLDEIFAELRRELRLVFYLRVSDPEVQRRLSGRLICLSCQTPYHSKFNPPPQIGICPECGGNVRSRLDDIPEMVRVRLRAFHRVIRPVKRYYEETGRLIEIDGEQPLDQVYQTLSDILEQIKRGGGIPAELTAPIKDVGMDVPIVLPQWFRDRSLDLVLVGGPGSGKGTQAKLLADAIQIPHVASGDLFRENIKEHTPLGKLAALYINKGELVPNDVTEAMVEARLYNPDAGGGFILDGFPRTLPQALALTDMMHQMGRSLDGVFYIKVPDEEIIRRISGRLICRNCQTPFHTKFNPPEKEGLCDVCGEELYQREDDTPSTVRARLGVFHSQSASLLNYYRNAGLLVEIDGEGSVQRIAGAISERTASLQQRLAEV